MHPHGLFTLADSLARYERDRRTGRLISAPGRTPTALDEVRQLAGYDLARCCPPSQPCHADLLLKLANPGPPTTAAPEAASASAGRCLRTLAGA